MQIVMQTNGAVKFTTVSRIPAAEIQSFQQESTWLGISREGERFPHANFVTVQVGHANLPRLTNRKLVY